MPLTRSFKATIQTRVQSDPAFREALLREGVESLLAGDVETGKAVLRDYINATIGFEELGILADKSAKSLMRMFGPRSNPQAGTRREATACLSGIMAANTCQASDVKRADGYIARRWGPSVKHLANHRSPAFGANLILRGKGSDPLLLTLKNTASNSST